jgi:hypothetical protein
VKIRWIEITEQDEIMLVPTATRFEWDGDHHYKLQVQLDSGSWSDVEIEHSP